MARSQTGPTRRSEAGERDETSGGGQFGLAPWDAFDELTADAGRQGRRRSIGRALGAVKAPSDRTAVAKPTGGTERSGERGRNDRRGRRLAWRNWGSGRRAAAGKGDKGAGGCWSTALPNPVDCWSDSLLECVLSHLPYFGPMAEMKEESVLLPDGFVERLRYLARNPVTQTRGFHVCQFSDFGPEHLQVTKQPLAPFTCGRSRPAH